jgi:imidazolonepropionase-like amidohydrolase
MRIWTILASILLLHLAPAAEAQQRPSPLRYSQPVIAITGTTLVDGTGAPARRDVTVVIRDGRIASVGPAARTRVPGGAHVIDGRGKTLLPGFVFVHEHMFYPAGGIHYAPMLESFPPLYLAGGVTTARTAGTVSPYGDINLKAAIEAGRTIGPDLDVTSPYIEGPGLPLLVMPNISDPERAARFVDYWADAGATSFKAYMFIRREPLRRAIDAAHRRGLKVTGHLCAVSYREAADLGIDNLEHGFGAMTDFIPNRRPDVCDPQAEGLANVDPDAPAVRALLRHLVARNVAVTSTLTVFEDMTPGRQRLPEAARALLSAEARAAYDRIHSLIDRGDAAAGAANLAKMMRLERLFVELGGTLLAGSDPTGAGGAMPGFASIRQIQLLVEAGFTFEQAVRIGTLNGARYLGRDQEVGTVAAGKRADLILVDGDPVANPSALDDIVTVFKAGRGYDRQALLDGARGLVGVR